MMERKYIIALFIIGLLSILGIASYLVTADKMHDEQYPTVCYNWNYVKNNGDQESDYYFNTDEEICANACDPKYSNSTGWPDAYYRQHCACCHARGFAL